MYSLGEQQDNNWSLSFLVAASMHLIPIYAALVWHKPTLLPLKASSAAIMVDWAPRPMASEVPVNELPPARLEIESIASIPKQEQEQIELPEQEEIIKSSPNISDTVAAIDTPSIPNIKAAAAVIAVKPKSAPKPVELTALLAGDAVKPTNKKQTGDAVKPTNKQQTSIPNTFDAPSAPVPTAPIEGKSEVAMRDAIRLWQGILQAHLEKHKRYPPQARRRRQEGIVYIRFSMDRQGKVLSNKLKKSSKIRTLDKEGLALIDRAQPMPLPPPKIEGNPIKLTVPVEFFIR